MARILATMAPTPEEIYDQIAGLQGRHDRDQAHDVDPAGDHVPDVR